MIKLKEVINQLDEENYAIIEANFIKNKAEHFLFLLQAYKKTKISENEIKVKLGITSNSLYVLKSRLYDKIQNSLSSDVYLDQEKTIKLLLQVPELCLNTPRETSIAYLLKLEKDLLRFDMHNELLIVYSALKKLHLNSDKYYHYSQIYNKQVSLGLSLEKAEETLGNFCRILSFYDFSKSTDLFDKLEFLRKEIYNIYSLCKTKQIELIKNFIDLQFLMFCKESNNNNNNEQSVVELLQGTRVIFDELPLTLPYKKWEIVLDYFCFEYYYSINSNKAANQYFEKVESHLSHLLLFNHIGLVSKFLTTKLSFCYEFGKTDYISQTLESDKLHLDSNDFHAKVSLKVYNAMIYFYNKKYKMAINCLNDTLNEYVFKDYFYEFLNIKISLLYFYLTIQDLEKAQECLKVLSRRVKLEKNNKYIHILYLLKCIDIDINKEASLKNTLKQRELFTLFAANNSSQANYSVIPYLMFDLKKKYQI